MLSSQQWAQVLLGVSVTLLPTDVEEDTVTVFSLVNIACWMVFSTDWVICHLSDNKLYLQVGSPNLPSIGFAVSSSGLFSYILVRSFMSACLTLVGVGQPKRHLTWPIPSCTKCEFHRNLFRLKAHFVYKMQGFISAPCCIFLSM